MRDMFIQGRVYLLPCIPYTYTYAISSTCMPTVSCYKHKVIIEKCRRHNDVSLYNTVTCSLVKSRPIPTYFAHVHDVIALE